MYRSFYEGLTFTWLPVATTLFFFTVFVAAVWRAFSTTQRATHEHDAALPLEHEETTP